MTTTNDLQNQIFEAMKLKETEELLDIWKTNDRDAWTNDAFLIIEKILKERLGTVPPQEEEAEEEDEVGEEEEDEEDETSKTLVWISSLTGALSYILLIFIFLGGLILALSQLAVSIIATVIAIVSAALFGIFNFVVLQLISKVVLVLLDIRDNTDLLVKMKSGR